MRIRLPDWALASFILCAVFTGRPAVADEAAIKNAGIDWAAFDALPDQDKSKFILAALDARDLALSNMRYTVRETAINIRKDDGSRRFMTKTDYEMRRLGDKCWMHLKPYTYYDPDGPVNMEVTVNWDGKKAKGLVPPEFSRSKTHKGEINPAENDNFSYRRLSELLGFRMRLVPKSMPVAQWLREAIARDATLEATKALNGTTTLMRVVIQDQRWRREIWLDPARGFMIVRFVNVYGKDYMKGTLEVIDTQQIAGVWVPKKAIGTSGTYHDKEVTEVTHEVKDFAIGTLKEHDLDIDFPVGTRVFDSINNVAYVVGADGK
jgi:hypothetical protein